MAWQSDGLDARGAAIRPRIEDIDPLTNIIGTGLSAPEPLLWMTLYPLSSGGLIARLVKASLEGDDFLTRHGPGLAVFVLM